MADIKVVSFPASNLNNVPEMMRKLADEIEQGVFGEDPTVFCIVPQQDHFPATYGWGRLGGDVGAFMLELELAKAEMVQRVTS